MRKKIFAFLLIVMLILCCGCSGNFNQLRIGTAGIGGIYNELANSLSQIASENYDMDIEVKTTAGSAANVRLLSQEYLELGIAQADIISDAYLGEGIFSSSGKYKGYSAIAGLYTEACHIVVRADSGITSVDELLNKKISVGEKESGTEQNANQILSAYGINSNMFEKVNLEYSKAAKQLQSGEIDAFFCTSGINTTVIAELSKQCDIRLLEISGKDSQKVTSAYKFYTEVVIPANTYKGQAEDIKTLGVKSVLLASDKMPEDKVETVTKMLFENSDELQYTVSATLELDPKSAVKGITIPFHKGAASYYNSKNINVNI